MKRPLETRVREGLDKYTPIIASLESEFQEFRDVIDSVKTAVRGLAKYHWRYTSDEFNKVIQTFLIEDDYSGNVTLIGRRIRTYASHPDLTLKQKMFLDQLDFILSRCLHDALEIFEESEKELIRAGIKIYMSASDGYAEFKRAKAALWDFQEKFHARQLDSGRDSRAIIYPSAGLDNDAFPAPGWQTRGNGYIFLTDEEQRQLKEFLTNSEKLRDLINNNTKDPEDSQSSVRGNNSSGRDITTPAPTPPKQPPKEPISILKPQGGTIGFGPKKNVHWPDSDTLPLPSPGVRMPGVRLRNCRGDPPPVKAGDDKDSKTHPKLPEIFAPLPPVSGPDNPPDHLPPTPTPTVPFVPPSSPLSLSSSDSETPPSTPSSIPVDVTNTTIPDSPEDSTVGDDAVEDPKTSDDPSPTSPSSSSSSSLPSVGSTSPTQPSSVPDDGDENIPSPNSPEDDIGTDTEEFLGGEPSMSTTLVDMAVEVRREVALSIRAYLGRRHNEYSMALSALSTKKDARNKVEREDTLHLSHPSLIRIVRQRNLRAAQDVKDNALFHWAGVATAKRQERINGYTRLRAVLKWAEKKGNVPLSPSSIRASTGLRRGLFEPLGPPELPRRRKRRFLGPAAYREATLASLAEMQPRLDLSLLGFLFNQDALRLFGGLVGEQPQPKDLARMDRLLRELVSGIWRYPRGDAGAVFGSPSHPRQTAKRHLYALSRPHLCPGS